MKLKRNINLVSRLTLDEAAKRMSEHNLATAKRVNLLLPVRSRASFEIIERDAESITFRLSRPSYRRILPRSSVKLGGILITGRISKRDESGIDIEASSQVHIGEGLLTSLSYLMIGGSWVIAPLLLYLSGMDYLLITAILASLVLLVPVLVGWRFLLVRIVDELFAAMKAALHGSPPWTLVGDRPGEIDTPDAMNKTSATL